MSSVKSWQSLKMCISCSLCVRLCRLTDSARGRKVIPATGFQYTRFCQPRRASAERTACTREHSMVEREGSNGFDGDQLSGYLGQIDAADDKLLELKSQHMLACKTPRAKIRETMKAAKEAGLNMTSFRAVVAAHRAERKIDAKFAELEADDAADYEAMREALGDFGSTPLGDAALKKAKPAGEQLDSLRG